MLPSYDIMLISSAKNHIMWLKIELFTQNNLFRGSGRESHCGCHSYAIDMYIELHKIHIFGKIKINASSIKRLEPFHLARLINTL